MKIKIIFPWKSEDIFQSSISLAIEKSDATLTSHHLGVLYVSLLGVINSLVFSSFSMWLHQFLSCWQGARQAPSVWKFTSFHSGKCLNYSFDYFLPINSLFFLSGTQVIFMTDPHFFFFLIFYLMFSPLFWELNMNGQVRNTSQLSKSNMTDGTKRSSRIFEKWKLGGNYYWYSQRDTKRIGSHEKMMFREYNNSTVTAN